MLEKNLFSQLFQLNTGKILALCWQNSCLAPEFHQSRLQCTGVKRSSMPRFIYQFSSNVLCETQQYTYYTVFCCLQMISTLKMLCFHMLNRITLISNEISSLALKVSHTVRSNVGFVKIVRCVIFSILLTKCTQNEFLLPLHW